MSRVCLEENSLLHIYGLKVVKGYLNITNVIGQGSVHNKNGSTTVKECLMCKTLNII